MAISAADVAALRERTGVGMMDCKKALEATDGNLEKAVDYLREKGIAKAAKKSGRITAEGIVDSYIHLGGKIGVLIEVNCETDFVAISEKFKTLVHDIALQIAACNPKYIDVSEVPADEIEKERKVLMAQAKEENSKKPEAVIQKMVEGRINKYYEDVVLKEQKFFKDPSKTIAQLVTEAIAEIGENITIRRFVRYERGEGIEKQEVDFAAEVSAQMAKK